MSDKVQEEIPLKPIHSRNPSAVPPSDFTWCKVNLTVKVGKSQKQLLSDVSGNVKAGQVVAIMGGSGIYLLIKLLGAGKSTLTKYSSRSNWTRRFDRCVFC